jgi:transposase
MSFYRGRISTKIHRFLSDRFVSFVRKKIVLKTIYLHFSKISNIEHRAVIKFFIRKGLNATEISKKLDNVYKDSAPSYRTIAKWVAEFKDPERGFEDSPRTGHPSTVTIAENIKAVERIVMRDRQISVRRVAYELGISTTTVYEVMINQLGMKKVSTRWVLKLLTPIQRTNRVDCCQELLQESEESWTKFYDCIVTGDETWVYFYDPLSQQEAKVWKKSGEETPTRLRQARSAGKIMMLIFWDKDGVLLTGYLQRGTTINGPYYASIIERLRSVILEKRHGKVNCGCCFFMTMLPFTSPTLFRLLFDRLASSNSITLPILQILHRLIIIYSQT